VQLQARRQGRNGREFLHLALEVNQFGEIGEAGLEIGGAEGHFSGIDQELGEMHALPAMVLAGSFDDRGDRFEGHVLGDRRGAQEQHRAARADDGEQGPLDLIALLCDPEIVQVHAPMSGHGNERLDLLGRRPAFDTGEEDADGRFDFRTLGRARFEDVAGSGRI